MNPKPLYRSMTLWLGLPGLLFIMWAWQDSVKNMAGIIRIASVTHPGISSFWEHERIAQIHSAVMIEYYTPEPKPGRVYARTPLEWVRRRITISPDPRHLFRSFTWQSQPNAMGPDSGMVRTVIILPHWMILLAYTGLWGGVIIWRARRHRHAAGPVPTSELKR